MSKTLELLNLLLPCHHCGQKDGLHIHLDEYTGEFKIWCECGISASANSEDSDQDAARKAISIWNTRVTVCQPVQSCSPDWRRDGKVQKLVTGGYYA